VFSESADLYDAIYRAFKDYAAEATAIATLVRAAHPSAKTILDVGSGTGEHALHLWKHHGFAVDGLDLDAGLLAVAREKLPDARFFVPPTYEPLVVWPPRTWLLREGWRRHGLVRFDEVPGPAEKPQHA
jgi:SAM-dependent methyltransferase